MTRKEVLDFLQSHSNSGSALGLSRVELLLDYLHHPEKDLKVVHVAGTNGKGSTIAFLSSILEQANYRVGRFQSPWVFSYEEQIRIGEEPIGEEDFVNVGTKVINAAKQMEKDGYEMPTEFEMLFPMACLFFKEKNCDIALIEVGLGGEGDATNVIPTPVLAVITRIAYDHMNYLGDTLEKIAEAKAGIIKSGGRVLLQKQAENVMPVFERRVKEAGGKLVSLCELPKVENILKNHPKFFEKERKKDNSKLWENILGLKGSYQIENASLAYSAAIQLRSLKYEISDIDIYYGLKNAKWPGRFEILGRKPLFIIDGAHNVDGAHALAASLKQMYPKKKFSFITGILADKEYSKMLDVLLPFANQIYCVTPDNPRALPGEKLAEAIREKNENLPIKICTSIEEALSLTKSDIQQDTLAFGSLYYLGKLRKLYFEK